jgi:endonuclease-3
MSVPRESMTAKSVRVREIMTRLRETYPDAHCELNFRNPLELLIATILSAQCSDKQVNRVTEGLFERYRIAADYANADRSDLEGALKSLGLFRSKARSIQACCRKLVERHAGNVPRTLPELIELDGVGRKTANVVLGNAFGIDSGVVVDTHVSRLSNRLGLTRSTSPERIERDLQQLVPQADWMLFSHWLIWHGRRRCYARRPDCSACEIQHSCPLGGRIQSPRACPI